MNGTVPPSASKAAVAATDRMFKSRVCESLRMCFSFSWGSLM